jgi:hypothetical protein
MYIVTSKPKRISVYSGFVHMAKLLFDTSFNGKIGPPVGNLRGNSVAGTGSTPTGKTVNATHDFH